MKIIAFDHFKPDVSKADINMDLLKEEMGHVWRLYKSGVVREIFGRADGQGAVLVFECGSVEEVWDYLAGFPLAKAGLIAWEVIPLIPATAFEILLDPAMARSMNES